MMIYCNGFCFETYCVQQDSELTAHAHNFNSNAIKDDCQPLVDAKGQNLIMSLYQALGILCVR